MKEHVSATVWHMDVFLNVKTCLYSPKHKGTETHIVLVSVVKDRC